MLLVLLFHLFDINGGRNYGEYWPHCKNNKNNNNNNEMEKKKKHKVKLDRWTETERKEERGKRTKTSSICGQRLSFLSLFKVL